MKSPFPAQLRTVLLYAHDTYGLGHLRRNLAIADHLLTRRPGTRVVLMSGSPVAERFRLPDRLALVRLPPVVKVGPEEYRARDPRWDLGLVRRARSAIMADIARRLRPDVFLVDHAPQGMRGELLPVFAALRASSPATRIVLGLRDVIDDPSTVRRTWAEQAVYETLETIFDQILVYGSADLLDVADAYDLPARVADKITYCGYLGRPIAPTPAPGVRPPLILGTAGGGGDGVEVLWATLDASRALGISSLVVTGPLMDAPGRRSVETRAAADPEARSVEFLADIGTTMAEAGAVVTMGGYNTLVELVGLGVPTVVVPRLHPRREQAIRAHLFAGRGLVRVVEPGPGLAARLRPALAAALAEERRAGPPPLDLDGLRHVAAALEAEAPTARVPRRAPRTAAVDAPPVHVPA